MMNAQGNRGWAAVMVAAILVMLGPSSVPTHAQGVKVLYSFTGGTDGAYPYASLVRDAAGNLYGTTSEGGDFACSSAGCGTVFKVDASGNETVLYSFRGGSDGAYPQASLMRDGAGNLYGTTSAGGTSKNGTVFKVDSTGAERVLYSFRGYPSDGADPRGGLIKDSAGNLYGTTSLGGTTPCNPDTGCGTVFKLSASVNETVLHSFTGVPPDGASPFDGLILDWAGNLYGTTDGGGAYGFGTAFKLDTAGNQTVLHSFSEGSDGGLPVGGLVRDAAGNLYGTTSMYGSSFIPGGTAFRLDAAGTLTVLHTFIGGTDGRNPYDGLVLDAAGNVYGTTAYGGDMSCNYPTGCGAVFQLSPTGKETLVGFNAADGANPWAGLVRDSAGNLYGTTVNGGAYGYGVVFELSLHR